VIKPIFNFLIFVLLFCFCLSGLFAQSTDPQMTSTQFDMTGFPQWSKDLRRAEIIAFGSFPLMYLFTTYSIELGRTLGKNNAKVNKYRTIGIAAGCSVLFSLTDYSIVLYKRKKEERIIRSIPPGTTIIIRRPLNEGDNPEFDDFFETESP